MWCLWMCVRPCAGVESKPERNVNTFGMKPNNKDDLVWQQVYLILKPWRLCKGELPLTVTASSPARCHWARAYATHLVSCSVQTEIWARQDRDRTDWKKLRLHCEWMSVFIPSWAMTVHTVFHVVAFFSFSWDNLQLIGIHEESLRTNSNFLYMLLYFLLFIILYHSYIIKPYLHPLHNINHYIILYNLYSSTGHLSCYTIYSNKQKQRMDVLITLIYPFHTKCIFFSLKYTFVYRQFFLVQVSTLIRCVSPTLQMINGGFRNPKWRGWHRCILAQWVRGPPFLTQTHTRKCTRTHPIVKALQLYYQKMRKAGSRETLQRGEITAKQNTQLRVKYMIDIRLFVQHISI